jgi:regulator of sigma E protease
MFISILAIVLVFGVVVLIHELGHFLAAKWMGVRVERFSIGFPPRLIGRKIGDTDYCISAIPIGGYVKMSGMIDESMDTQLTGADYEFNSKPVWKRMIIIVAGVVMNFILAIIVLTILNYVQGERITPFTEIGTVGPRGVTQRIGFKVGDQILAINGVEVKNWEAVNREFFNNLNEDIIFRIRRNGQEMELKYQKQWFKENNAEYLDINYMPAARVGKVVPGMPAAQAGLKYGDEIIQLAGTPVNNWLEMTNIIRSHPADTITVDWRRNGETFSARICPQAQPDSAATVGKIGIETYFEYHKVSFPAALINGIDNTFSVIVSVIDGFGWVISGAKPASEMFGGPIMIGKIAINAVKIGWGALWSLIAYLSATLALINILPVPALDGGHLTFLLIEGITRKPLSVKVKLAVQQVGMAILLTLIVYVLYLDFKRFVF